MEMTGSKKLKPSHYYQHLIIATGIDYKNFYIYGSVWHLTEKYVHPSLAKSHGNYLGDIKNQDI